ncbi:sigma-54-dependent Fis family transcriptional regulator [Wenzhouxiangella sp. XN79A]|uniref:sigma-54-dependent transcriptional regulator n=1 Tax=Wenzhouxiangella sp. XN79A TaxID=2724193 RepID=UPI00144A974B|nr:response regulator [Wenzhouxiangella sp. XN79A]NKI35858.1 sigma-54-dependent Fis family transcriptional regulator [Wenzhouxiangella sp. XN79A]
MPERILIVDDEPDIRELIGEILDDEGFQTDLAGDADQARRCLAEHPVDLVLLDVWMPGCDGVTLLKDWRERGELLCPVVMISGHGSVEAAVEATRHGAFDFIEKPVSMARLLATIKRALSEGRRESPIGATGDESDGLEPIGRSAGIERVRSAIAEVCAGAPGHLLIEGEPGTGCTTLARWVHAQAGGGRFAHAVCDPAGDRLAVWTDALDRDDPPRTVYLDRLHQLDEAGIERLGDLLAAVESRGGRAVRVIASRLPGAGAPPAALLAKLGPYRARLPALSERAEDIPDLVRLLAERLPAEDGLTYRPIPLPAQNRLRQHDWPGNLAELVDVIRGLLDGRDSPVDVDDVEAALARAARNEASGATLTDSPLFQLPLREAREAFERQYLIARLRQVGGSVGQLADAVEMERTHLYRKLKQLGIDPKKIQEDDA